MKRNKKNLHVNQIASENYEQNITIKIKQKNTLP